RVSLERLRDALHRRERLSSNVDQLALRRGRVLRPVRDVADAVVHGRERVRRAHERAHGKRRTEALHHAHAAAEGVEQKVRLLLRLRQLGLVHLDTEENENVAKAHWPTCTFLVYVRRDAYSDHRLVQVNSPPVTKGE